MTDIIKLDMTDIWASGGDKIAPTPAKVAQGWIVEAVPRQTWNWFENRQDQNIAYLLQKGFPEWDNYTEFLANKSWINRNGIIYKAILTGVNKDPVSQPTYWVKAFPESSAALEAIRVLTPAADRIAFYTSASAAATTPLTAFMRTLLDDVDATTARTTLAAQASHANLTALAGTTGATNMLPYYNAASTMTTTSLTAFGRSLIDDADAAAGRTTLDLITQATSDDATVNRVMKTGAFGLGSGVVAPPTITTFNQNIPTGMYRCVGSTTTGSPFGTGDTGVVFAITTTVLTVYFVTQNNTRRTWTASYLSGVLSPWTESAPIDSPNFTGTPTVPQAASGDYSTKVANTAFVFDELAKYGLTPSASLVSIGAGIDLNTMQTPGFYGQSQTVNATLILNYPAAIAGTLLVQRAGSAITTQIYMIYSTGEMYTRGLYTSTWSAWRKAWDTGNTSAMIQTFLAAADAATGRVALSAAKSGANTDITSLTGVTLAGTTTLSGAFDEALTVTLSSAATTNIAGAASSTVSITGNTTITALGTAAIGVRRQAKFTGVLTLTHHATNLNLPGNANIVTAVGDVAEFTSKGSGTWDCTMYTRSTGVPVITVPVTAGGTGVTTSTGTGSVVLSAGPTFTGVPLAPTAAPGTNTTQLATTAFVAAGLALKANLASPSLTGVPLAPTAAGGTNNTQIATTAFVTAQITSLGLQPTTSNVDSTPGRIFKVGDFGLGAAGPTMPNLAPDSAFITGFYRYDPGSAGNPTYGAAGGSLIVNNLGGNYVQQIAQTVTGGTTNPQIFMRHFDSTGSPGPWVSMYHNRSIVGTVSQSSGVPTGAIMEAGSNGFGEYTKYADGRLICVIKYTPSVVLNVNTFTIVGPFTTPATFVDGAFIVIAKATPTISNDHYGVTNSYPVTANTCEFVYRNGPNAQSIANIKILCVGRWY